MSTICVTNYHSDMEKKFTGMLHSTRKNNLRTWLGNYYQYLAGFLGQMNKRKRWMPWQSKAKKDVAACEKPRGVGRQALIRGYLNGGTRPMKVGHH